MKNILIIPIDKESLYGITTDGKVWSFPCDDKYNRHNGKWLKQSIDKDGYNHISLSRLKEKSNKRVHRLVAEAFISNPENKPEVNHKDGNKQNNNVDNLEWVSMQDNITHSVKNGISGRGTMQKRNTSGYIGVSKSYKKWAAYITVSGKVIKLGRYDSKIDAALAYDKASIKYHGCTGKLNFKKGQS